MGGVVSGAFSTKESINKFHHTDFEICDFIAEGGTGKVYVGKNKHTREIVALKFFGYVEDDEAPPLSEPEREMQAMRAAVSIEGIVRLHGYFLDTAEGLLENKIYKKCYHVIVMEYLEGGPLLGAINYSEKVSEKFIARLFKGIVLAVKSLHEASWIHRDLKLTNIMLVEKNKSDRIKVIDLGIMVKTPRAGGIVLDRESLKGTPGYYAPESINKSEYSSKSDMFQLGCVLYSLLSGFKPFEIKSDDRISKGQYFPLTGLGWMAISESAKDLVANLLQLKPSKRLSADEVLLHPWIISEAPDVVLGADHKARIKNLALGGHMRELFLDHQHIKAAHLHRCESLRLHIPELEYSISRSTSARSPNKAGTQASDSFGGSAIAPVGDPVVPEFDDESAESIEMKRNQFNEKVRALKLKVLNLLSSNSGGNDVWSSNEVKEIDYSTFAGMCSECGLEDMCKPSVFGLFDIGNTGTIDPKEFLLTMLAFRPDYHHGAKTGVDAAKEEDEAARLYFDVFDIHENGYIELAELKFCVRFILSVGKQEFAASASEVSTEELFATMDAGCTGKIYFEEFKKFYHNVMSANASS